MYLLLLLFHIFVILIIFVIVNNFSKKIIINLIFGSLLFSTLISIFLVYEVVYLNSFCYIELGSWFNVGSLSLTWTFYFDKLTVLMVFLILMISFLVHCFAYDYLRYDPHLIRFLILLSIFTIFMEILVTAGTTVQLFLGCRVLEIRSQKSEVRSQKSEVRMRLRWFCPAIDVVWNHWGGSALITGYCTL